MEYGPSQYESTQEENEMWKNTTRDVVKSQETRQMVTIEIVFLKNNNPVR